MRVQIDEIKVAVENAKDGQRREIFESARDLKDHLEIEHGLSPLDFNKLVGFTSEYKDKMREEDLSKFE